MKGRKYRVTIRECPNGNLDDFIMFILEPYFLEPYYIGTKEVQRLPDGIKIINESEGSEWIILDIMPEFWQEMLPEMMKIKDKYRVDWDYKILDE